MLTNNRTLLQPTYRDVDVGVEVNVGAAGFSTYLGTTCHLYKKQKVYTNTCDTSFCHLFQANETAPCSIQYFVS